ncbi:MAG: fibronectin type III domain-containing protein, partial [Lentisphaeria bacterium]|nr:fibronectin type III domain-containing protein [Lentisphaeria bacterium]
ELKVIKTAVPDWSDAERIAAQAELDECLREGFGGHSMEQVYIYERLTTLAEAHWEKGNKQAATILYEFSLKFLSNHEKSVFNTLARLAAFKTAHLSAQSSVDEVETALAASAAEKLRFFDFFPDGSTSESIHYLYNTIAAAYFKYFPKLLSYDDYREQAYQTAYANALRQNEHFPSPHSVRRLEQIQAWQLARVKVRLRDAAGNPRRGSIKVANVTADTKPELFPNTPYREERIFQVDGEAEIPVYTGHIYEITARIAIPGGNDLVMTLPSFPQQNDRQIVYDTHGNPIQTPSENGPAAEIVVAASDFPYNLRFERDIDVFTLNWDWVDTADFKAAGFKVFNGDTLVAAVTGNRAANIRLAAPDGNYTYTVAAFDADGKLSRLSVPITIEPGDQSAYTEFFDWLHQYFGELPILSTDDPDGDGVDNYHEFLNGTDPTRAPAPTPTEKQVSYTKITLNWECPPEQQDGAVWKIRRNGTEVGISLTASFTDSGLIPGMEYRYTIRGEFANGSRTDWSAPLLLKTQKPETVAYGDKLQ